MSKIIGDPGALKRINDARPGDKTIYVNMDAISNLPDEFEIVVSEIKFDVQKDFTNVGSDNAPSYLPNTELSYKIADAKGISGGEILESASVYEEVDINPMLCKPMDAPPTYQKIKVGHSVTKYSTVIEEDGTLRRSSPRQSFFNVWERCLELWSKEEMYTEGYSKPGKYGYKYDTRFKRRAHFDSEMKFAQAKADTKAHTKTVRELAGLPTGFKPQDLASGSFVFAKVRRSKEILKLESAARVDALRRGIEPGRQPAAMLFGPEIIEHDEPAVTMTYAPDVSEPDPVQDVDPAQEPKPAKPQHTKREEFISVLGAYLDGFQVPADLTTSAEAAKKWLSDTPDAETNEAYWRKCLKTLELIEAALPEQNRIVHRIRG